MWVIAHRGASGTTPENTLAAFQRAADLGAGFIETDLQLSKDMRLVAIHDETLDRTTNGRGAISAKTLDELRQLDAGAWFENHHDTQQRKAFKGERIPTLDEVLAFGRRQDIGLYLELKASGAGAADHVLVAGLRGSGEIGRSVVISFDAKALARLREIEPLLVTGFLYSGNLSDPVERAVGLGARQLLPREDRISPQLTAHAHRRDLKVVAWTVDSPVRMKELMDSGVDGIITDYPERLLALVPG